MRLVPAANRGGTELPESQDRDGRDEVQNLPGKEGILVSGLPSIQFHFEMPSPRPSLNLIVFPDYSTAP